MIYYIFDGEITFLIGKETHQGRAGDFVVVPRDTLHAFRIDSETAHFLNGYTPASMEAMVADMGTPTTERVLPPKDSQSRATPPVGPMGNYGLDWLPDPDLPRPNDH